MHFSFAHPLQPLISFIVAVGMFIGAMHFKLHPLTTFFAFVVILIIAIVGAQYYVELLSAV